MAFSSPFDFNEESIYKLDEKFSGIINDRFLYCIQDQQKWDHGKANHFVAELQTSHQNVLRELGRLEKLEESYNAEYPSEHKKYVTTAQEVISKMRSTLSGFKKIVTEFREKGKNKKDVSLMDDIPLYTGPYMKSAFGWDCYMDESAEKVLAELESFLTDANKCVDKAVKIINDEIAAKNNPEYVYMIYQRDFNNAVRSYSKPLIDLMNSQNIEIDNDFVKSLEEAEDIKKTIAHFLHAFNYKTFTINCACVAVHEGRKADLTDEESLIWGREDEILVKRLRLLLDHIMELPENMEGVIGWEGRLKGHFVMRLLYWCGWNGSKNDAMLKYITKRCDGIIGVVGMSAVQAEKRKHSNLSPTEEKEQQQTFNQQIDAFIDSLEKNSTETN